PINSVSSGDGRLPRHEIINDDFSESGVVYFIALLLTFVFHLIHKIFPDKIGTVNVAAIIQSP
nr:hypothetical protein [Tanacetum cinerariifolium]